MKILFVVVSLLNAIIKLLQKKVEPESIKPTSTKRITYKALHKLLRDKSPDAELYLSDKEYLLCSYDDIALFLAQDETNKMDYQSELYDCEVPPEVAYGLGLFYADGNCGLRKSKLFGGASWRITGWKKNCLERTAQAFNDEWQDMNFYIKQYDDYKMGSLTNYGERKKDLYCLELGVKERHNNGSRGQFIKKFRDTCYFDSGDKKVPAGILESSLTTKRRFLEGVIDGDGMSSGHCISVHGRTSLAELMDLMMDVRWKFSIYPDNGENNYRLSYNRRQEGKGRILEFLDGKGFLSTKTIHTNTGVTYASCSRWLKELAQEGCLELKKPWSQRLEAKLVAPYNLCDDFSYRLMGQFSIPGWSDLAFGIVWTSKPYAHALNCMIDEEERFWFVEPQTDELIETIEGVEARFIIM